MLEHPLPPGYVCWLLHLSMPPTFNSFFKLGTGQDLSSLSILFLMIGSLLLLLLLTLRPGSAWEDVFCRSRLTVCFRHDSDPATLPLNWSQQIVWDDVVYHLSSDIGLMRPRLLFLWTSQLGFPSSFGVKGVCSTASSTISSSSFSDCYCFFHLLLPLCLLLFPHHVALQIHPPSRIHLPSLLHFPLLHCLQILLHPLHSSSS